MKPVEIPSSGHYTLANARLHASLTPGLVAPDPDGFALVDLSVGDGRIGGISPARGGHGAGTASPHSPSDGHPVLDLAGRIVLPCFVDCHTHLDKGHIWPRASNPDGSFMGALGSSDGDRFANWGAEDVARRMDFSLRCAFAHGTKAVRTHLDSIPPQEMISWPIFAEMRERWRGRIELQAVSLFSIDAVRDRVWLKRIAELLVEHRGVLGVFTYMVPDLEELLDRLFGTAADYNLDLDFHADETGDPAAIALKKIAEAAMWSGFERRVLVGHCCSLSRQPDLEALDTLDKVAKAGLGIVSLPMCNMYLQDRRQDHTTPQWRGVTLVHEMRARGIPVAIASDNTRDPFYAYGDLDMLEVYRMATRILHLDHPIGDWPRATTATPAELMRLPDAGTLKAGGGADFIVFRGRSWTELLSRPESDRIVVRDGRAIERVIPDYAELDELMV